MSKKNYLFLLIPVLLIIVFIVVNYKPLSLAIKYYNDTNVYRISPKDLNAGYFVEKVKNDVSNNNYKDYMLDITDYYITSDFVYIVFDKLDLLESYFKGMYAKVIEQCFFITHIKYGVHSRDNQKITEMIKYYPIEDMEKFPELTLKFIDKMSNYSSLPVLIGLSFLPIVTTSKSLCYIVVTRQGCNRKDYYFDKFIYDPYKYAENLFLSKIPFNEKGTILKEVYYDSLQDMYRPIQQEIQEIENECRLQ